LSRFVSLVGVRWTQRGVALVAAAVLLPTLARIVFVLLTLYMLPTYWNADRMSIPHQVYRWSGRALTYAPLASLVLWTGAMVAVVLPRFPQARPWWAAAARVAAGAAVLGCAGLLYGSINLLRQLPTFGPIQRNLLLESTSALLVGAAACVGWSVLGLRLPRASRRTRWLIGLGLLVVAGDLVTDLVSAVDVLITPASAPTGGLLIFEEAVGWRRAVVVVHGFWAGTALPYKQLVLLVALWAYTRVLKAAADMRPPPAWPGGEKAASPNGESTFTRTQSTAAPVDGGAG